MTTWAVIDQPWRHNDVGRGEAFAVIDRRAADLYRPLWIGTTAIDGRKCFAPTNATGCDGMLYATKRDGRDDAHWRSALVAVSNAIIERRPAGSSLHFNAALRAIVSVIFYLSLVSCLLSPRRQSAVSGR